MSHPIPAVHTPPGERPGAGRHSDQTESPPDLFATVLAASAEAPPPQAKQPQTRTAHAEGTTADRDSIGSDSQTAQPAASASAVADATGQAAGPIAVPAQAATQPGGAAAAATAPAAATPAAAAADPAQAAAALGEPKSPTTAGAKASRPDRANTVTTKSSAAPRPLPQPQSAVAAAEGEAATAPAGQSAAAPPVTPQGGSAQPVSGVTAQASRAAHQPTPQGTAAEGQAGSGGQPDPQAGKDGSTAATIRIAGTRRPRAAAAATPAAAPATARAGSPAAAAGESAPAATSATPASAAPAATGRVRVEELAAAMQTVVRVARARGSATARITLRPAELGGVQVRLRCQAGSITAQLTAETAAGAQALSQAGDDLRRSLQSQGVNLLALEVRVAGDGVGAETGGHQHEGGAGTPGGGPARPDQTEEITIETSRLPDPGAQVDVLA